MASDTTDWEEVTIGDKRFRARMVGDVFEYQMWWEVSLLVGGAQWGFCNPALSGEDVMRAIWHDRRQRAAEQAAEQTELEALRAIALHDGKLTCPHCQRVSKFLYKWVSNQVSDCRFKCGLCGEWATTAEWIVAPKVAEQAAEMRRLRVLLAWEAGEITEGNAMKYLGMDRLDARELKMSTIDGLREALAAQWQGEK
jgi:hypothetical protein